MSAAAMWRWTEVEWRLAAATAALEVTTGLRRGRTERVQGPAGCGRLHEPATNDGRQPSCAGTRGRPCQKPTACALSVPPRLGLAAADATGASEGARPRRGRTERVQRPTGRGRLRVPASDWRQPSHAGTRRPPSPVGPCTHPVRIRPWLAAADAVASEVARQGRGLTEYVGGLTDGLTCML